MKTVHNTETIDFAKLALERNDEAIRFSEAKAGFITTLIGLLLGLFADKLSMFIDILSSNNSTLRLFSYVSIVLLVIGTVVAIVSTFFVLLPRLKISKRSSFLYFGSIGNISEDEFLQKFIETDTVDMQNHLLSQVHATSVIAKKKFFYARIEMIGAFIMLSGWLLALSLLMVF